MARLTRAELQVLSKDRLKEADVLLKAGLWSGAYHMTGMAVECALKACIAKQTREFEFPDKDRAKQSWIHDLNNLLSTAGLQAEFQAETQNDASFSANWNTVKDWKVEDRYNQVAEQRARDIFLAATEAGHGILSWIENRW